MNMAKEKAKKEKKKSSFWKDFKAFISRGNIVDLAVAVVVGAAFTAIVNSLVNDIIKPLITLLFGGEDMSDLVVVLRTIVDPDTNEIVDTITLNYGNLIMAILTFLIDAFVIFTVLRIVRGSGRSGRACGTAQTHDRRIARGNTRSPERECRAQKNGGRLRGG